MNDRIDGLMFGNRASRNCTKIITVAPISRWTNRSRGKPAAAIRTNIADYFVDTCRTKSALECAYPRFQRIGWKRLIAVFARGTECERFNDIKLLVGEAVLSANLFL